MGSSNYPLLNLPTFDVNLRSVKQRTEIFDSFRQRYIKLTPEEWVRQHTLHYLVEHLNYPKNRIAVEVSLNLNKLSKRADILVYSAKLVPWMIIECKASTVKLNQSVFDQAARYNLVMNVPYLAVTNGIQLQAAEIIHSEERIIRLEKLPDWNQTYLQ